MAPVCHLSCELHLVNLSSADLINISFLASPKLLKNMLCKSRQETSAIPSESALLGKCSGRVAPLQTVSPSESRKSSQSLGPEAHEETRAREADGGREHTSWPAPRKPNRI